MNTWIKYAYMDQLYWPKQHKMSASELLRLVRECGW